MVAKAQSFKNIILRTSFQFVDRIKAASALWNNVAIPTFLYGADVVPISATHIKELDVIQNQLGKALLGLPQSTANPVVAAELGWKPFQLRVSQVKLSYFKRVGDPSFKGSPLVGACMCWNISVGQTLYMNNLKSTLSPYSAVDNLKSLSIKDLCTFHEEDILSKIQLLPSLRLLPIPKTWWYLNKNLSSSRWCNILTSFKVGNAGLGNRDAFRSTLAVLEDGGRVTLCPLCFLGPNDEIHLLLHCEKLRPSRTRIMVDGGLSLESSLRHLRRVEGPSGDAETVCNFLGQTSTPIHGLIERGLALDILLDEFFLMWTTVSGRQVSRKPIFNYN